MGGGHITEQSTEGFQKRRYQSCAERPRKNPLVKQAEKGQKGKTADATKTEKLCSTSVNCVEKKCRTNRPEGNSLVPPILPKKSRKI